MADPAKLDRYRPLRTLGTGGMGTVSLASDTVLARQVALKRVTGAAGASGMLRLRREALVGASISHPNLVSIYDVDETEDGELIIVMEYVDGETLRDAISRDGALGTKEGLRILSGAAAGLDAIHERGIVHRDVKPANVLLGRNGDVKVADLGIAAVPDRTQITTSGAIIGSLGYMAPEQMHEAPATAAIDIYALAAVAYEALSGQKARREPNPVALAYAMENKPPPDLREVWPDAPPAAAEVLRLGMDRDPARRPGSAGELVSRLRDALQSPPTARMAPAAPRRQPPAVIPLPAGAPRGPARAATRAPAATAATPPRRRRRSSPLVPIALLTLVAAAAILAVALAGSDNPHRPSTAAHHRTTPPAAAGRSTSSSTGSSSAASASSTSPATTTPPSAAPAGSPGATATSFYTLAAGHHYAQAWALADPAFQSQLGGYQSFQNTFAGDRSITVESLRMLSRSAAGATVAITTTSVRTDGTQHCSGTVELSPGPAHGGWLMHHIQIGCQ